MSEHAQVLSKHEEKFEQWRRRAGYFAAPVVALVLALWPLPGLAPEAHRLLAVLGLVVTLWVTEALPLPATALLGPTLCVLLGVGSAREVYRSFADPIILLFLGSFLLAEAMLHHGLNRRIAFQILALPGIGQSPGRLLAAFGAITGLISMFASNTATTAMMFPIGLAILTAMARRRSESEGREVHFTELRYGTGLMLMAAFASSIGGLGTPVGTPTNLVGIGLLETRLGVKVSFAQWMLLGVPLAVVLIAFLIAYLHRVCPAEPGLLKDNASWLRQQKAGLGPMRRAEWNVVAAFTITILLWLGPGLAALLLGPEHPWCRTLNAHLPESAVALVGAMLLFLLPVNFSRGEFTLSWAEARRIDWGTILLFGGGLALGDLMFTTGLAKWLGEGLAGWLEARTLFGLIVLFSAVAIFLSETTSNTASATMVVPVAIAVAQGAGVDPVPPAMAACLAASMGFMLPVSTPPNAIVYGSGCIPITKMIRHGLVLDVAGFVAVVAVAYWVVPRVLGR